MSYLEQIKLNPAQAVMDAGGILRVGSQTTLFDGKTLNADDPQIWENVGTGTGTFTDNKFEMSVSSGQYYIKQSRRRFPYFSGKSQRIEETFLNFGTEANVVKRFGYFSSIASAPYDTLYDGFWLENDGSGIRFVVHRNGTEVLDLPMSSWSGYSRLGSYQNPSTWNNFSVVEFKFLWLGGAVLVLSIKTNRGFTEAHRFDYAGTSPDVFILSPNQPLRYEIRSTTGSGTFTYVCSQVATEGSVEEAGQGIASYNPTLINTNAVGTIYAIQGIRKSTTYRDNAIQISNVQVLNAATTDAGVSMLIINPTLSAPLTYSNYGKFQRALATNQTITANTGRVIYASGTTQSGAVSDALNRNYLAWLSSTINNTHDEYVVAYMPITTTQSVVGIVNLKEY